MKSVILSLAVAVVAGVAAGPAAAQGNANILQQRENQMKNQAQDLGAVKGFLDGKTDQAAAAKAAADLVEDLQKVPAVFPPGSGGTSPDGKFATKPEIWSDWNGFLAAAKTAAQKAEALSSAAKGGDKAAIQAAFADLGKNGCGGCHGKYREEVKK